MGKLEQFMVVFQYPEVPEMEFFSLIPQQRLLVAKLFLDGTLLSYTLNEERTTLWAVFSVPSYNAAVEAIEQLPLTKFGTYDIHSLTFHNDLRYTVPTVSLN